MKLSFVVTTHGAMKTSSSSVEYAVMYALAWMRVPRADRRVVLDERAAADDDVVAQSSPARARTTGRRECTREPIVAPANTIAPVETIVPSPITAGGSGSRFAVDFGPSAGCLPTTAFSSTRTPSPSTVPG